VSRFSDRQIAFILPQAEEGTTVEEVCRKAVRPRSKLEEVWRLMLSVALSPRAIK